MDEKTCLQLWEVHTSSPCQNLFSRSNRVFVASCRYWVWRRNWWAHQARRDFWLRTPTSSKVEANSAVDLILNSAMFFLLYGSPFFSWNSRQSFLIVPSRWRNPGVTTVSLFSLLVTSRASKHKNFLRSFNKRSSGIGSSLCSIFSVGKFILRSLRQTSCKNDIQQLAKI